MAGPNGSQSRGYNARRWLAANFQPQRAQQRNIDIRGGIFGGEQLVAEEN